MQSSKQRLKPRIRPCKHIRTASRRAQSYSRTGKIVWQPSTRQPGFLLLFRRLWPARGMLHGGSDLGNGLTFVVGIRVVNARQGDARSAFKISAAERTLSGAACLRRDVVAYHSADYDMILLTVNRLILSIVARLCYVTITAPEDCPPPPMLSATLSFRHNSHGHENPIPTLTRAT